MAIAVVFFGLILMVVAVGYLTAVSIGIKRDDRRVGYRALRDGSESGPLSTSGRRLVNLSFRVRGGEGRKKKERPEGTSPDRPIPA
ncbi:hypothetical protein [Salinactinospora qingdaonensis]|uniref:Uncharacterized protein n=1 Tax=Salinactinospora qingdaonensis TaxID=702744 RepID=A0ABP7FKV7_9ACTN